MCLATDYLARLIVAVLSSVVLAASLSDEFNGGKARGAIEASGLHNVLQLTSQLYSGSGPAGDESFRALERLRVKTIISVDGARPDLERAKRYGMRYVHIPIGYSGVPRSAALKLTKAVRELPGPIYVHCHHGKHRGAAAAAIALLASDPRCSTARALSVLQDAGTDPRYKSLFQSVRDFQPPSQEELAEAPTELPETVAASALVQTMVDIDQRWDNIRLVQEAGWQVPASHPDIDPPHEVLQVLESLQELQRLPQVANRPQDFGNWLFEAHAAATELEKILRAATGPRTLSVQQANSAFKRLSTACITCHANHRDSRGF